MFPRLVIFVICALEFSTIAHSKSAFVKADEIGQGILRLYDGRCFIFIPSHVLGEPWQVDVVLSGGATASFDVRTNFEPDIGIAEASLPVSNCPQLANGSLDAVLRNIDTATLQIVLANGNVKNAKVDVLDLSDRYIGVRPNDEQFEISKGMSGAALVLNGAVIAQLQTVDAVSGVGKAIRLDYLLSATQRFFDAQNPKVVETFEEPTFLNSSIDPNLVVRGSPALVVSKTDNKGVSFWWQPSPVFIDVSIGGKSYDLSYLQNKFADDADKPIEIQVMGNTSDDSNWFSILTRPLKKFETGEITVGELPAGLAAVRFQFLFSSDVKQPTIGSLRFN